MFYPLPLSKNRSRRLRKKLRIGEFQEFGFELSVVFNSILNDGAESNFLDDLIDEVITPNGLSFGGGIDYGYITLSKRGSATLEDIKSVSSWLDLRNEIKSFQVGALQDAWYPPQFKLQHA